MKLFRAVANREKPIKCWLIKLPGFIGGQTANLIDAITTGLCSAAAFASLFLIDGWIEKLGGFLFFYFGFFILAYFIVCGVDKVRSSL